MHEYEPDTLPTDPGGPAGPGRGPRRRRGVRVTTAAAVALGLAVAGGAVAGAAASSSTSTSTPAVSSSGAPAGMPDGGKPPAAVGTVKSVGSGTFTLTAPDGSTVTVDVSSSTNYRDPAVSSQSFADVTVGAHVAVFGTEASGTVTATSVAIGAAGSCGSGGMVGPGGPGGTPPSAVGTVKSVGSEHVRRRRPRTDRP